MKIKVFSEISTGSEIIKVNAVGEIQEGRIIFKPEDVEGIPMGSIPIWDSLTFLNNYAGQYQFISGEGKEILSFDQFIRKESAEDDSRRKENLRVVERLRDYLTLLLNNPKNIGVLFKDSPKEGTIGCNLVQHTESAGELVEKTDFFQFRYTEPVLREERINSYDELKEYYEMAVRNKWVIERYYDPAKLMVGFIVRNLEESVYYWAHISALKKKT